MQRYMQLQRSLMTAIAQQTRSDAVLEVRIVKVKASVRSGIASWDEMTEPVMSRKARDLDLMGETGQRLGVRRHRRHEFVEPNGQHCFGKSGEALPCSACSRE